MNPEQNRSDFETRILNHCDSTLLYSSRIHPLPSYEQSGRTVWVKREDESGFGISGAKKRKYASLLPYLKRNQFQKVILIGGSRSNNIAGLVQLLNENRIAYELFLKEEHQKELSGNRLFLHLLTSENNIRWITKDLWPEVEAYARSEAQNSSAYVVPEGGSCQPAFPGACTLGLDIMRESLYDHIWLDSGTALTAGAVIEVLNHFAPGTQVHVVQMAGNDDYFWDQMKSFHQWMEALVNMPLDFPDNFDLRFPAIGKSFGSVGGTILNFIQEFARTEGILTDPIYSAKLFYTVQQALKKEEIPGRHLVIHTGGGVGLMGFGTRFQK